jgi:very-short-patch-repair endonuclease
MPSTPSSTVSAPNIAASRRASVEKARDHWIRKLTDTSRRNTLLFAPLTRKTGVLDLSQAPAEALARFVADDAVPLRLLAPDTATPELCKLATGIGRKAESNLDEKGIQTLYVTLGIVSWRATDGKRPIEAPVLLLPATLSAYARDGSAIKLQRNGEAQVNLVMLQMLADEYGIRITPESLFGEIDAEGNFAPDSIFAALTDAVTGKAIPDFSLQPRHLLGNFSFQKMSMVRDLRDNADALAQHDLIAALSGDAGARAAISHQRAEVSYEDIERLKPDQQFLVVDADSSQQRVIESVARIQNGVIQGPPGTGKSQTIVNMIATLAARGARVLFVAEKKAALEVVKKRLERVGLGHLALDLHGAELSRRAILARVAENLNTVRTATPVDATALHTTLSDRRAKLSGHVARIHTPVAPSALSPYALQGALLRQGDAERSAARWRGSELTKLSDEAIELIGDLLDEAGPLSDVLTRTHVSEWVHADVKNAQEAQHAADNAMTLAEDILPDVSERAARIAHEAGARAPVTRAELEALLAALKSMNGVLAQYRESLIDADVDSLARDLAPADKSLGRLFAGIFDARYRAALQKAKEARIGAEVSPKQLLAELRAAGEVIRAWKARVDVSAKPRVVPDAPVLAERLALLNRTLDELQRALPAKPIQNLDLTELQSTVERLNAEQNVAYQVGRVRDLEAQLKQHGAGNLLDDLRQHKPAPETWRNRAQFVWRRSLLERAWLDRPELNSFNGRVQDQWADEFRDKDKKAVKLAQARVRRAHANNVTDVMNAHPDQDQLVRREAAKKSRHLPFRTLLSKAPDLLTALFPCWMASPLSVSQLLNADQTYFDIVIFDEASQVLPEDAVPALMRAKCAVVAGDRHQLPPTTFFAGGEDPEGEADDDDAASDGGRGFESLLDQMSALFFPWTLEWHYRSKDESLIAFSNKHIYANGLVSFPSVQQEGALIHELVEGTPRDGQQDSSSEEALRVVDLIVRHVQERPDESLGVIALGVKHADRIQAVLDARLDAHPELEKYFDEPADEKFFIKNLERVQGDERDAIILSVGYGKDPSGKLPYRFGPLLSDGGERRLNVAVTRARSRLTLVSSFSHHDMDPGRSKARGVELLRLYLQFAASGGRDAGQSQLGEIPLNPFELDIYEALTRHGLKLLPQWGASKFRIDFVVQHPERPGQFVLAIECDGASYHSAPTARDRDRLRQQILEGMGWTFHRIWSTDWFNRRDVEIERTLAAYRDALAVVQNSGPGQRARPSNRESNSTATTYAAQPEVSAVLMRKARPVIRSQTQIDLYLDSDIKRMIEWVRSDGLLRTNDVIINEVSKELGFGRVGKKIKLRIEQLIGNQ